MGQGYHCRPVHGSVFFFPFSFRLIKGNPWQGGGIAAGFAAKYPDMVDEKIILLAPAGLLKVYNDLLRGVYCMY
jgi:hypothetical protein